jgi:chromosome segregation ATPase
MDFNETLTMINTMYQEKSGEYVKKSAELTVQAQLDAKNIKKIGVVKLNLAEVVSGVSSKFFPVSGCPDKKASVCLSIKCNSLGESTIVDNISEASGNSVISMGTEGEYSGPLFNESIETDEETKKTQAPNKKPPMLKKKSDKSETNSFDNIALIKVLQKENQILKSEREELKVQIGILSEKTRNERDQYCENTEKLEAQLETLIKENKKIITEKENLAREIEEFNKRYQEIVEDLDRHKNKYNHADKKKLKDQIKTLKQTVFQKNEENEKLVGKIEELNQEKKGYDQDLLALKNNNQKISRELEALKDDTAPQGSLKEKTQKIIEKLKKELKEAQEEIEDLRAKQTDAISQSQQLKNAHSAIEDSLKEKIRKLEFELSEKNEEINELSLRLEEEIQNVGIIERKTLTEKEETEDKLTKLNKTLKEIHSEKDIVEQNYTNYRRNAEKRKSTTDITVLAKLEATIESKHKEIAVLYTQSKEKDKKISELTIINNSLQTENSLLQEKFKFASISEFSDPATSILTEKICFLETKIKELKIEYSEEKSKLSESIKILENQLEIIENNCKQELKASEEKISSLTIENILLKEKSTEKNQSTDFISSMQIGNYKQDIDLLKLSIAELKGTISKLSEELKTTEQKYQEAKLSIAKKDLEKENTQIKYKEAQEQLREYAAQYTTLEVELYKVNERFGQALNANNALENELQDIKEQIHAYNTYNKIKR